MPHSLSWFFHVNFIKVHLCLMYIYLHYSRTRLRMRKGRFIVPYVHVLKKENEFGFVGYDSFCMSSEEESSMAHQKMRKVSTLSCHKNFT